MFMDTNRCHGYKRLRFHAQEKSGGGTNDLRLKSRVGIMGSGLMSSLRPVVEVILFVEGVFVAFEESRNEETSLSTFEKGLLPGDLEEFVPDELALLIAGAGIFVFAIDLETDADAEDTDFLTADVAAEALLLSLLELNSFSNLDPTVLEVLMPCVGVGAVQLWSAGNLCEGQNCSLHCGHLIGANSTFLQLPLAQTGKDFAFALPVITEHSVVK